MGAKRINFISTVHDDETLGGISRVLHDSAAGDPDLIVHDVDDLEGCERAWPRIRERLGSEELASIDFLGHGVAGELRLGRRRMSIKTVRELFVGLQFLAGELSRLRRAPDFMVRLL